MTDSSSSSFPTTEKEEQLDRAPWLIVEHFLFGQPPRPAAKIADKEIGK